MRTSICIPTFNGARYIEETLRSIGRQTRAVFEVVVSDDGSHDDTVLRAEGVAKTLGLSLQVAHNKRRGPTQNYLNAVSLAQGDVIMLADQDDPIDPRRNEVVCNVFQNDAYVTLVSSDSEIVGVDLSPTGRTVRGGRAASARLCRDLNAESQFRTFLRGGLPFLAHTLAFPVRVRPLLLEWPEDVPSFWMEEWVTAICACAGRIAAVPDALTRYRQHEAQFASLDGRDRSGGSVTTEQALRNRVEKMRHLMALLEHNDRMIQMAGAAVFKKRKELAKYIEFVERRLQVRSSSQSSMVGVNRLAPMLPGYFRYARGFLSIASDSLQVVRTRFRSHRLT